MLISLHVKNLALIDETEVYFGNGLNILTGETGAGKSIIIGSVNLALGAKAEKEMIRTGADYALVELVFQIEKEEQLQEIRQLELPVEEDGTVILQRRIMPGKSLCKVGGETVSVRQVKALAGVLIDIHGQHEHQSLLKPGKQLEILDDYAGEALYKLKKQLKERYEEYKEVVRQLSADDVDEETRKREISLAEFEAQEIEEAGLSPGEDIELEKTYRKLVNGQKIQETLTLAHQLSGYEEGGAGDAVGRAVKEVRSIVSYDETLQEFENQLLDIDSLLNDYNRMAADYLSNLEFDGELFSRTEKRLDVINHLKSKYAGTGNSIEEILAYQEKLQEKLEKYQNFDAYKQQLLQKESSLKEALLKLCGKISKIRKDSALKLAQSMKKALIDLNFMDVAFEINVQPEPDKIGAEGYDKTDFMISTNPGEALKSLSQVASGGELSRIMLALKTVLADKDEIETLIFDEIDTGISGKTAWKVSEKMGILGKKHQLICITHLPQIAAMADTHFQIEKSVVEERSVTRIRKLEEEDSIKELARMLGGASITETVLNNAREMKDLATKSKQY
ncbi:MAG: DNA repair protein RecN [Lachnospiraceae bacterium]|nr:DNA repair protein RecN [Lachnospiraceae bacterium]